MSTTFTVLVAVCLFSSSSVAVYVIVYVPTLVVSTVPVDVTVSSPLAVAPASVYVDPFSMVAGLFPFIVISGAVVSTTFIVLVAVPVFFSVSVAVYVIVYVPTLVVSTVPVDVTVSPPSAVAPASVYVDPFSTVAGLFPFSVITGAVVSTTLTILVAVCLFPSSSVAVYVIVYAPTVLVLTLLVDVTVSPPLAVAPASVYVDPFLWLQDYFRLLLYLVLLYLHTINKSCFCSFISSSSVAVYVIVYVPTVLVLRLPVDVTVSPPLAVAPASVYVDPFSTVAGLFPYCYNWCCCVYNIYCSVVVSFVFLSVSVAEYVIVYSPTVLVSTVLVDVTVSPPLAVAPASVYVDPFSVVSGLSPFTVITGAAVSTTLTNLVAVPSFPDASVAVYVTVYTPTILVLTLLVDVTGFSPPLAVAPASV